MAKYGLIGRNISYSFSRAHFARKFEELQLHGYSYENFDLQQIEEFPSVLAKNPDLSGLNVTIPYKEAIIPYLDELHSEASEIGAVNTIKFAKSGLKGYNTDAYGFRMALLPRLQPQHTKALILGTGGASRAVVHVLGSLDIAFTYVSRTPASGQLSYKDLSGTLLQTHLLIINTTPLGTHPKTAEKPQLPYGKITPSHFLFDLIYNPGKTAFLLEGEKQGAQIENGLRMLELQAEKAWEIWGRQGT